LLQDIAHLVKGDISSLNEKVKTTLDRTKQLEKELQQLKSQQAAQESSSLANQAREIQGVRLLVTQLGDIEPKMLRTMVDDLKNQLGSAIIVLSTVTGDKVSLIVGITK
ncbi:DHHA1 domain-containing protein, partial [Enterobacter hormaechei]|nr:DHHA1 domain-containing protein [Enterobacter hormaechei]